MLLYKDTTEEQVLKKLEFVNPENFQLIDGSWIWKVKEEIEIKFRIYNPVGDWSVQWDDRTSKIYFDIDTGHDYIMFMTFAEFVSKDYHMFNNDSLKNKWINVLMHVIQL